MKTNQVYQIITYFSSLVWLANGLLAKVLNLVPRHQEIVGRILSQEYSRPLTFMIGISEIIMALWILRPVDRKFTVMVQVCTVSVMNCIEFILVPDLLLFGRLNALFALLFIILIYSNELLLNRTSLQQS